MPCPTALQLQITLSFSFQTVVRSTQNSQKIRSKQNFPICLKASKPYPHGHHNGTNRGRFYSKRPYSSTIVIDNHPTVGTKYFSSAMGNGVCKNDSLLFSKEVFNAAERTEDRCCLVWHIYCLVVLARSHLLQCLNILHSNEICSRI